MVNILKHIGRDVALKDEAIAPRHCQAFIDLFNKNQRLIRLNNASVGEYAGTTQYSDYRLNTERAPSMQRFVHQLMFDAIEEYRDLLSLPFSMGNRYERLEIMKFSKEQDQFDPHFDSNGRGHTRSLAIIWYLNDVNEGGELHLPSKTQPLVVNPKQGRMVIVPTDWTHYHYVTTPKSNDRYSLITFINYH